ncbi:MAG: hypothetical protein NTY75_01130 [Candidatus Shapirobacteria bacterium]|nr:hypothetical protein [Candidatus Shapirobacteria bacterium]
MNFTKYRPYFLLLLATIIPALFIWYGFYLNLPKSLGFPPTTLETIYANYDGPNYMIISKCWYNQDCIRQSYSLPIPLEYYPAHLPGFPLVIKYFSLFVNTPKAMLLATLFGSLLLTLVSFQFFKLFLNPRKSFWLAILFIFFPARLFITRLVGAPESWFISLILLSVIYYRQKSFFISAIFAALAQLFKSPGILLFATYGLIFLIEFFKTRKINFNFAYYLLIPLTVLGIFYVYYLQTGDFLAYFHSGDNIHLFLLPYSVFISNRSWINTIWLEDVLYLILLGLIGVSKLYKKFKMSIIFIFPALFLLATIFVAHRDISRYLSPIYPFIFVAFSKYLTKKPFKYLFLILFPAIILYTINFLIGNTAPITSWAPYL